MMGSVGFHDGKAHDDKAIEATLQQDFRKSWNMGN
jgi:hypothetical protein